MKSEYEGLAMFEMPKVGDRREKWLDAIRLLKPDVKINVKVFICEAHFANEDIIGLHKKKFGLGGRLRLEKNAVPKMVSSLKM